MSEFSLQGRVVVVTGGAGKIGRVFCRTIAAAGGRAIVADTATGPAQALVAELQQAHGPEAAHALSFDITRADAIDSALAELEKRFGAVAAVVNNAYPRNSRYGAKFEEVTFADFSENVSWHLGGYFLTAQRFARHFARQRQGNIINMGSIYGTVAPRFDIYEGTSMTMPVEYAAIKAGVLHLTRYLAQYLKPQGIRVNAISPGGIFAQQEDEFVERYGRHALGGKMLTADALNGALQFLLSEASAHVTGQNIIVDDGWTL